MKVIKFALLVLILCAGSCWGTSLLVNQVNPVYNMYGYGLSDWDNMSAALNGAFGAPNITVDNSPLTNLAYMLSFDRLWITARGVGDPGLTATEIANVQAFTATGRRVALIGENSAWMAWNNSILATVGGSYDGQETSATLTPLLVHPLTSGVASLSTIYDGIAIGGTSVFSLNVISLWGGSQNVVSILSVNLMDDTYGAGPGNRQFETNLAAWLAGGQAIPEPSTWAMLAGGLLTLGLLRRKRS